MARGRPGMPAPEPRSASVSASGSTRLRAAASSSSRSAISRAPRWPGKLMRAAQGSRGRAGFSQRSSVPELSPSSSSPCASTLRRCSTWNCSTWNTLLGGGLALAERFLVFGSAFGHDDDLAEAPFPDAHRGDTLVLANTDMDRAAVAAGHRIQAERRAAPHGRLDHPRHQALEMPLSRVRSTLHVQHDAAGGLLVAPQQQLIREQLKSVWGAGLATREYFRRGTLDLDDRVRALLTLANRKRAYLEPLD